METITAPPETMYVPFFAGPGELRFETRPIPHPAAADDVMVAVKACGICGTDLNILAVPPAHKARPGIILGHEGVGVVAEIGPEVRGLQPGDRVVVAPRLPCGRCAYCRRGLVNQCDDYLSVGTSLDGALAPYLRVPERALYPISAAVAEDDALFFEPLSCVVGALARVPVRPGDRVAIIGGGPMGALFALVYRALGAGLVLMADVVPYRLEQARRLGADVAVNSAAESLKAVALAHTGIGCDVVVDAVGNQLPTAIEITRRGGHVILFGLRPNDRPVVSQYIITRYDLTVIGAFVGLHPFEQTLQFLESGAIHPGNLITHRLPLSALAEGVALMRSGQAMKVAIRMDEHGSDLS
jgi:threonine dehydrogenase-like Zn-dependent dehydrogenase